MNTRLHNTEEKRLEPYAHPAAWFDEDILAACTLTRGRSSGPGGQHRNRVETQVTITHDATGLTGQAGERREAHVNKRVALRRLRLLLATKHRIGVPDGSIGSPLWRSRLERVRQKDGTHKSRIVVSPDHRDYASLLAEAMDTIDAAGHDMKRAGLRLNVSQAQLVKLIAKHLPALAHLNEERQKRGLQPLRA